MAWRRPGDKPLSEPMMVSLPMHICITRPQWVNQKITVIKELCNNCNIWMDFQIQWNPSRKARVVSLKLQNLVHFHAPFFTNHVYFTPHDRPPLLEVPLYYHTLWPEGGLLFAYYITSLLSLCRLIWKHWTCKCLRVSSVECVSKIKSILSIIFHALYRAVCLEFSHFFLITVTPFALHLIVLIKL